MKTLYIVRHAKAIVRGTGIPDFDRSLAERGIKDARKMSKRQAKAGAEPQLLISSPAKRAIETARIFAKRLDYPKKAIVQIVSPSRTVWVLFLSSASTLVLRMSLSPPSRTAS